MDTNKKSTYSDQNKVQNNNNSDLNRNCYLAIANIPMQNWNGTYAVEKAFQKGTIFPELDLPFLGKEAK